MDFLLKAQALISNFKHLSLLLDVTESYCLSSPGIDNTILHWRIVYNGLLCETLNVQDIVEFREFAIPKNTSGTFHGRDLFAKAAAEIDLGLRRF